MVTSVERPLGETQRIDSMRRWRLLAALGTCVIAAGSAASAQPASTPPAKPNIIILLADDLGYGGLGVQGDTQAVTPHIDALAAQGVRMTNFYASHPVCSPTRAALLTGKYQHRMGFEHNSGSPRNTSPKFGLPDADLTLAQRLKAVGYATGMFGKWHVGFRLDKAPGAKGFDEFYGFLAGAHAYTPTSPRGGDNAVGRGEALVGGGRTVLRGTTPEPMAPHMTEALASEAVAFIDRNRQRPFFVYLPFNAVHSPMDTTKAYYDRFAQIKDETRRVHLAQLAALDDAVGRVVAAVEANGLANNTLIIFSSDNGGPTQETTSSNGPLNGVKGLLLEGGIRVPTIVRWDGKLPRGRVVDTTAISFDLTATALKAGGALPKTGLDGVDLTPYLTGARTGPAHPALFWRAGSQGAVRSGDWKLVRTGEKLRLFDLKTDLGERNDLAAAQPKKAAALNAQWRAWSAGMPSPAWVRNELSGGDPPNEARIEAAIDRFVRGERPDLAVPE